MTDFLKEYKRYLEENEDVVNAENQKRYLYSTLKHYGLSAKQQRDFLKKYRKQFESLSKETALELAQKLWDRNSYEEKMAALAVVDSHKEELGFRDMPWIEKWMRECKGWAFLDSFIIPYMPLILEKDRKAYTYLRSWIKDNDFWVRRSALLSQLLFFRKNLGGDKQLFFDMAKEQFDESWIDTVYTTAEERKRARFFIRKAIGWTLREMGSKDPESAFMFLKDNKGKMSGLSFRDGSRRLPKSYKDRL